MINTFEGRRGTGKTLDTIERMIERVAPNYRNVLYIPTGFKIVPVPPFYREEMKTVQVLGVENSCWDWGDRHLTGQCSHRNCKSGVRFYASKPIGHTFFFDIDSREKNIIQIVKEIVFFHGFSHFIITKTAKGFHIWICEITQQKMAFFELFNNLKRHFDSDYEFHGQWVLRLGGKQLKTPPRYFTHGINRKVFGRPISNAHLVLLKRYAKVPARVIQKIVKNQIRVKTFAKQVLYHSFKELWPKLDDV